MGGRLEGFETSDCPERSFQLRPEDDEPLETGVEVDDSVHRNAQEPTAGCAPEIDGQGNHDHSHCADKKLQHQVKPSLDAVHEIVWSLGSVEKLIVGLDETVLPSECANGQQTFERFGEARVQRALGFQIQVSDLPGCA
jgi:hypothetical protein